MPPTRNSLQKDRQFRRAQLGFPFLFLCQLAEYKLRHHKEVMSQMCVKTRITYEVVEGTYEEVEGMSGEGKQKHYYHVLGIVFAPIQTTKEVVE